MHELRLITDGVTHQMYAVALKASGREGGSDSERDRGAVSLEQVLWFVAAGVSVAVIAAILWGQIRTEAEKSPTAPVAP